MHLGLYLDNSELFSLGCLHPELLKEGHLTRHSMVMQSYQRCG